jgi:hypothetical protein
MPPAEMLARRGQTDTGGMKVQATILISYRADALGEAGDKLDDA